MNDFNDFEEELLSLDERIRRLAIACDVDVTRNDVVVSIIKGSYPVSGESAHHTLEEIRGLLMLKYNLEAECLHEMGAEECARVIDEVEQDLKKKGFR